MNKKILLAASALFAVAAIVFAFSSWRKGSSSGPRGFVRANGVRFVVDGKPFRFVGANVDVMFQQQTRAAMPEMMRVSASAGMKVVRIWASGEGGLEDVQPANNWRRDRWFRRTPTEWNEAEFVFLDRTIAEAARHGLKVQICLANWWRDTGGVTQYLRWAGINGADDDNYPFGINDEKAMLFYTNETARRLYREHVEKIVGRRNTVTGVLYRDDPNIFGYELMNEARCLTGRWEERRAWIAEMSAYVKSLDPNHVVAPGAWGYRTAAERREWLKDHALPHIDYVDVHNYPRDDEDSFVDSPKALGEFVANRVAAAATLQKPLVFGEFGIPQEGFKGASQLEWYRAFFEHTAREGASGAMFWILTPEPTRGYGVTYSTNRDAPLLAEIRGASHVFSSLMNATPPPNLLDAGKHLVPRQFAFARNETEESVRPQIAYEQDGRVLYKFAPEAVVRGRFEKLGGGPGYIWGGGVGYFEFIVPERETRRRVGEIVVRAHIQPVMPTDAKTDWIRTRVMLFVNGTEIDSRLVTWEDPKAPLIQEWTIDSWGLRLRAARGLPFTVRFELKPDADWLYGVNISTWPEGYDAKGAAAVEVELR